MDNFHLKIFEQITKDKPLISQDDNTDNILYSLNLLGYIKVELLPNGRLKGFYLNTKKPKGLRRLLNA